MRSSGKIVSEKISNKISDYFRSKRVQANLSQQDVANSLGFTSGQFISNWERRISTPPLEVLPRLVKIYKLNKSELMELYVDEHKRLIKSVLR